MSRVRRAITQAVCSVVECLEERKLLASVTSAEFVPSGPRPYIEVEFDQPASTVAGPYSVSVLNLSQNSNVPVTSAVIPSDNPNVKRYEPNSQGPLANGYYETFVRGSGIDPFEKVAPFSFINGDFDSDGAVNFNDFLALQSNFGTSTATFAKGDSDYDGDVDFNDFLTVQSNFGLVIPVVPTQSGSVVVSNTEPGSLDIWWKANTETRQGFKIYRSDDGGTTFNPIATIPNADAVTWRDDGTDLPGGELQLGHKYWYRVRAYNGNSVSASVTKAWGIPADATPLPQFLAGFSPALLVAGQTTTLNLSATGANALAATKWEINWGNGFVEIVDVPPTWDDATLATWSIPHTFVTPGTRTITAKAIRGGFLHQPVTATITVTANTTIQPNPNEVVSSAPPSAPASATGMLTAPDKVTLSWTASEGDPDAYIIYAKIGTGDFEPYASVGSPATTYDFYTPQSVSVAFKVSASNEAGESARTDVLFNGVSGPINVGGTIPPAAPAGLNEPTRGYTDGVTFNWQASPNADGYAVEWSTDGYYWDTISETDDTSFTDKYPALNQQHYRVRAYRVANGRVYGDPSQSIVVTPIAPPVAWNDNNAGSNERGTISTFQVEHDPSLPILLEVKNDDVNYDYGWTHIPANGFSQPENGTITLVDANYGRFEYMPDPGFVGTDTFTYVVNDGDVDSQPATVTIDVTNTAPIAYSSMYEYGSEDWWRAENIDGRYDRMKRENFLGNHDAEGDAFTYAIDKEAEFGEVVLDPQTGAFTYTPDESFNGVDQFTYTLSDGLATSSPASIIISSIGGTQYQFSPLMPAIFNNQNIQDLEGFGGIDATIRLAKIPPGESTTSISYEVISGPERGTVDDLIDNGYYSLRYTKDDPQEDPNLPPDEMVIRITNGAIESEDVHITLAFSDSMGGSLSPDRTWASASEPSSISEIGNYITIEAEPEHGTLSVNSSGRLIYTPDYDSQDDASEMFIGWDFYSYRVGPDSPEQWVKIDVGAEMLTGTRPTVNPLPSLDTEEASRSDEPATAGAAPSREDLEGDVVTTKGILKDILLGFNTLGIGVDKTAKALDLDILDSLDEATQPIDGLVTKYGEYIKELISLNKKAADFLVDQWYVSQADAAVVAEINKLPFDVGSLKASFDQMEALASSLKALGEGASIAIKNAGRLVDFAEGSHKVLSAVEMAGGVTALVKTGATLLIKEGIKACAKAAAKEVMQSVAQGLVSPLAGALADRVADLAGVDPEFRQYISAGVDAYQAFSFLKAAKTKVDWNGSCFVAGTQVVTGINSDGKYITKAIEQIEAGDTVLSRDQNSVNDDVTPHTVKQTFVRTSDHLRTLSIRDSNGNIETIKTTDEHPLWVIGRGWVSAGDLQVGDRFSEADGTSDSTLIETTRQEYPDGIIVYNFEVEGDHTYFIEDGQDGASAVWVHNRCVGDKFVARTSSGKVFEVDAERSAIRSVVFTKNPPELTAEVSEAFAGTRLNDYRDGAKAEFLRFLANDPAKRGMLEGAGLEKWQIDRMLLGDGPSGGWSVHHKLPKDLGGTNDFENLLLIRDKYHYGLTAEQNDIMRGANPLDSVEAAFPMFDDLFIYDRR